MISHPDQRVGVFIDVQNMYYSARYLYQGRRVNFGHIVETAVGDRKLIRAIAYVVKTKAGDEKPFIEALQKLGIETAEKELLEYLSGQKKADWDVGITMDIVRMLDMLDVIVLVSGDGDFVPVVEYCRNRGRIVQVMSFRESTSTKLVESADVYVNLSDDKKRYLMGPAKRGAIVTPRGGEILIEPDAGAHLEAPTQHEEVPEMPPEKQEENRSRRLSF